MRLINLKRVALNGFYLRSKLWSGYGKLFLYPAIRIEWRRPYGVLIYGELFVNFLTFEFGLGLVILKPPYKFD